MYINIDRWWISNCSCTICWKNCTLSTELFLHFCWKSIDHVSTVLFVENIYYSLIYLSVFTLVPCHLDFCSIIIILISNSLYPSDLFLKYFYMLQKIEKFFLISIVFHLYINVEKNIFLNYWVFQFKTQPFIYLSPLYTFFARFYNYPWTCLKHPLLDLFLMFYIFGATENIVSVILFFWLFTAAM